MSAVVAWMDTQVPIALVYVQKTVLTARKHSMNRIEHVTYASKATLMADTKI
jgi:hypothetical protein